jgi:TPP-dependent indolepyruvate ferredoxin oxidoreductase alpha subunit
VAVGVDPDDQLDVGCWVVGIPACVAEGDSVVAAGDGVAVAVDVASREGDDDEVWPVFTVGV